MQDGDSAACGAEGHCGPQCNDADALAVLAGAAGGAGEGGAVERELRRFDQYCTHDGRRFRDQRAGIVEVAGRVEPGMEIKDDALEFVQAYLDGLLHAMFRRTSTLSAARAAVETCVPGELAKHAESEGTKASQSVLAPLTREQACPCLDEKLEPKSEHAAISTEVEN